MMAEVYWTVRRRNGSKIESRQTFLNEASARQEANKLVGTNGCMVELIRDEIGVSNALHVEVNNVPGSFTYPFNRVPA